MIKCSNKMAGRVAQWWGFCLVFALRAEGPGSVLSAAKQNKNKMKQKAKAKQKTTPKTKNKRELISWGCFLKKCS